MDYSFAPHMSSIGLEPRAPTGKPATASTASTFALVDAAQLKNFAKVTRRKLANVAAELIFEDSFAKAALDLSPVLFELSAKPVERREQMLALDAASRHLPVMTVLQGSVTLQQLVTHLRSLLLIEADGLAYLLRFADSQMLMAANSAFTPEQRASVFSKLDAWWTVDHNGVLNNAADPALHPHGPPAATPLCLDARQTHALLSAVAGPLLAGQLRHLEMSFARTLSHAEQMRFVGECIVAAREAAIDDDADLTSSALERWLERRQAGLAA